MFGQILFIDQTFTNICGKKGCSEEFREFNLGAVIGCCPCNKSVCEISSLLDVPRSIINGFIGKWRLFGTAATR